MKKITAIILAALMVLVLGACNNQNSSSAEQGLKTVQAGKLIMATDAGFAPYEYTEDGETPVGIDVDIAKEIAAYYGLELVVDDMDFTNALLAPQNGTADFTAAGVSITDKRKETMDFTIEYATSDQVILVRKGETGIQGEEDLADVKIGVQQSTTADLYCEDMGFANVSQYKKYLVAAEDLKNGKIDCIILDHMPAESIVKQNEELEIVDEILFTDKYALAVKKGNSEMVQALNEVLQKLIDEGKIEAFTKAHLDAAM